MWVACTYIVTTLYKKYTIHAKHVGAMHTRVRVHTYTDACACTFSYLKKTGRSVGLTEYTTIHYNTLPWAPKKKLRIQKSCANKKKLCMLFVQDPPTQMPSPPRPAVFFLYSRSFFSSCSLRHSLAPSLTLCMSPKARQYAPMMRYNDLMNKHTEICRA
jgi:hypothetical protein